MSFPSKTARNAAIIRAFKQGASRADLAEQYGLSQQRIGHILLRAGIRATSTGRPALAFDNVQDRRTYEMLRSVLGAEVARKEMGLAA